MPSNCCRRGGRSTEHGSPKQFFGKYDTKRARTTNSVQGRIESVHYLVYPRRGAENTFLIHEGPRRTPLQGNIRSVHEGPRRTPSKGRGEHLLLIHEGPRRTPFVVDSSRLAAMMGYWLRGGFSGGGRCGGDPPAQGRAAGTAGERGNCRGKGIGNGGAGCRAGFQGGVAGGIPPHKGGPQARPPHMGDRQP